MRLECELLKEDSVIQPFDCGEIELNSYLKDLALVFQYRRFGVTLTFFDAEDSKKKVVGFYTLSLARVHQGSLPEKLLREMEAHPISAFRICRLAIDKRYRDRGADQFIFVHALEKCLDQANQIGGNVILIDAPHEKAKTFYQQFGFLPISSYPLMLMQTIKYLHRHFY